MAKGIGLASLFYYYSSLENLWFHVYSLMSNICFVKFANITTFKLVVVKFHL
jgi:hypothetical protein